MKAFRLFFFIIFFSSFSELLPQVTSEKIEVIGDSEKKTESFSDSSSFVSIIDSSQFQDRFISLQDVLEREAGVRVKRYGGLGSYSTLSIRGSNAAQVNIYIDGVPLNNAQGGEINLADLSFDNLERIEIYKSNAPPGLGGAAIGGSVNLVTKKGFKKGSRVNATVGDLKTARVSSTVYDNTGEVRYSIFAQQERSDQKFAYFNNRGTLLNPLDDIIDERKNAWFNRYNFTGNAGFEIQKTKISLLEDFTYREQGIPGPSTNQNDKVKRKYSRNTTAIGTETPEFLFKWMKLDNKIYYTGAQDHLFDPESEFSYGTPNSKADLQQFGWNILPVFYLLQYNQIIRVMASVDRETFKRDKRDRFDETKDRSSRKFRNHSLFQIQDEIRLFDKKLILVPAVTYEEYADRYNDTTPDSFKTEPFKKTVYTFSFINYKGGFNWNLYKSALQKVVIKANTSTERRIPSFLELFGERGSVVGNSALKPEKSVNNDIGLEVEANYKNITTALQISLFQKKIQDMILLIPNSQFSLRPENIDSARITGIEATSKLKFREFLKLDLNYTYQKAINTSDVSYLKGKYLPLRPLHDFFGKIGYLGKKIETGWESEYTGAVFTDRSNDYYSYRRGRWIHGIYLTFFIPGSKNPEKNKSSWEKASWTLNFEVKNILNYHTYDTIGYPLPGRLYYFTLGAQF